MNGSKVLWSGNWKCGFRLKLQYQFQNQNWYDLKRELSLRCRALLSYGKKTQQGSDSTEGFNFFIYSHHFLVVQEAQEVPRENWSSSKSIIVRLSDSSPYLF